MCGWASSNQVKTLIKTKDRGFPKKKEFCLETDIEILPVFPALPAPKSSEPIT